MGEAWEECGRREAARISRMPLRGLEGWVGDGCYIDKRENRFADIESCRDTGGLPTEMIGNKYSFYGICSHISAPPISRPFFFPKLRPFFRG